MTDGMTVTSLSASPIQMKRAAMDGLCEIALNSKLSLYSKSGVNVQVTLKVKLSKKKLHKM
jgi:hypothetical protein